MDEDRRSLLEGLGERRQRGEQPGALVGGEAPSVSRLDAVLEEVLELPARQPPVEAPAEGEARRVGMARAGDLERGQQLHGRREERARVRGLLTGRGPERRVAEVFQEEEGVGGRRVVMDERDGEAARGEVAAHVDEGQVLRQRALADLVRPEREAVGAEQHRDRGGRRAAAGQVEAHVAAARGVAEERLRADDARAEVGPHGTRESLVRNRVLHRRDAA